MEAAAAEAVKAAAIVVKEEETKLALEQEFLIIGEVGLEKKAMEAFREYKEADQLVITKSIVTDFDLEELETKKEGYLAVKKAKKNIMKEKMAARLGEMRKLEDGVVLIEQEVEEAYDDLKHMKDKSNEFPDDTELAAEVAAQQTRVEAIDEVFVDIIELAPVEGEAEISIEETEALKRVKNMAAEKQAYNQIYNEGKDIIQAEETQEFEMYFDAVKHQFEDVEARYGYAVEHMKDDATELATEFDGMMTTYKAAMNVKFDLEEWKREAEAEIEIELPEEDQLAIKTTIEYLVQKKDRDQIQFMLETAYDTMSLAQIQHDKEPENECLSVQYQFAKEKYALNKEYYQKAITPIIEVESVKLAGGWNDFQAFDETTTELVSGWQGDVEEYYQSQGSNTTFT
jgi:hypothetical protein